MTCYAPVTEVLQVLQLKLVCGELGLLMSVVALWVTVKEMGFRAIAAPRAREIPLIEAFCAIKVAPYSPEKHWRIVAKCTDFGPKDGFMHTDAIPPRISRFVAVNLQFSRR